ncbi:MAG: hypothetical protein ACOC5B_01200 [Myxococcota bacterium]
MKRGSLFCFLSAAMALGGCSSDSHETAGPISDDAGSHPSMDGAPATDGGRTSTGSTELPCEVEEALESVCRDCHGDPPQFGAPMSLMTWEDTQQPGVTDESKMVHELIGERINSSTDPMPPQGFDLTPEHKAALDAWVGQGAPKAADGGGCTSTDGGTDPGGPGVGPDELPCTPDYEFTAHDEADPTKGYSVPLGGDGNYYICFSVPAPFEEGEQATAWAPIISDERVLHHWILWESPNTGYEDGEVFPCGALPDSDSKFLMGWAPGGKNFVMPSDVGLGLNPDSTLLLQVHYWNATGIEDIRDESGVAVCTDSGRPEEAGVIAVGPHSGLEIPPRAEDHEESFTCPGFLTDFLGEMNVLASSPHMHQLGERFTTEIIRNEGTDDESVEPLTDVDPWDFNNQTSYPHDPPVTVEPGDGVRVTCTYDNPYNSTVEWGENSEDEMCFDFLLVYPLPSVFDTFGVPANCTDTMVDQLCSSQYASYVGCP